MGCRRGGGGGDGFCARTALTGAAWVFLTLGVETATFWRATVAGLRAVTFFVTFALVATVFRAGFVGFFAAFPLLVVRLVTFRAFLAGAFTAETRFAGDLGRADLVLRVLLLLVVFVAIRRADVRRMPFVTGLLI